MTHPAVLDGFIGQFRQIVTLKEHDALESFVAGLLVQGDTDQVPMTLDDARQAISEWRYEGVDFPDGLTPQMLSEEFNRQLAEEHPHA